MKFVIFHGAFGSPQDNWFPVLKEKLEALDQEVLSPTFPVENWDEVTKRGPNYRPTRQSLDNWLQVFQKDVLPKIEKGEKLCFVGHSLGSVFILHAVDTFNLNLDCAIFVSPFMDSLKSPEFWQFDVVNNSFYKTDFGSQKMKKLIPVSYVIYSSNDPYVDRSHSLLFAKTLDSSLIFVKKAGHMNAEVNLNEFPLVFDLCATRIDLSLYQQYIKHRSERYASDYLKKNRERVVHLTPEDIFDEGKFHFENLHSQGFCTFWSDLSDWNPNNQYYEDCRKAAKRIKKLTRVILVKKLVDLTRPVLLQQIQLDLQSGIKIYLCIYNAIKSEVTDPDFGIWDFDYLCTIHYDSSNNMNDVVLSSKKEDLRRAKKWESYILERASQITNTDKDINDFIKSQLTQEK